MEKMKRKSYSESQRHEKREGRSNRSGYKEEWIYGINPVLEAIKAGRGIKTVYLSLTRKRPRK